MKRLFGLVLIVWLVGGLLAGAVSALTIYKAEFEYSDFGWQNYTKLYQLDANGSIVPALYRGDEASLPAYLDATLFCPLDDLDTTANTTTCYLDGTATSATISQGTGAQFSLVQGRILNALELHNASVVIPDAEVPHATSSFDIVFHFKLKSFPSLPLAIFKRGAKPNEEYNVYITSSSVNLRVGDGSSSYTVSLSYELQLQTWYTVHARWTPGELLIELYDENGNLVRSTTGSGPNTVANPSANLGIGTSTGDFGIVFDEVRLYIDKTLSQDELALLLHINRYKFATLSAPAASFDGSQFLVNVTAQLPSDGGSYLLPAPASAVSSYTSAGQIGNFTFLDVGTASTASFQVPAKPGQAVPGLSMLGIETDEGLYAYGSGSVNLTNPLSRPLYGSPAPLNHITAGKVTAVDWSGANVLTLFRPSGYINLAGGDGTLKFLKHSQEYFKMDVTVINPIKLNFKNLAPLVEYNVLLNTEEKTGFTADDYGQATYTLSNSGTWEIGLPNSIYESFSSNILAIATAVLIVAIFVGFVVEQTPQKWDDNAAKALFAIIAIAMALAIVKLILYLL